MLLEKYPIDGLLTWNLLARVYRVCRCLGFCTHSNVYSSKQRSVVQLHHGWSSCLLLYERFFRHQVLTLSDSFLMRRSRLRRVWTLWSSHHSRIQNKNRNPANNCRLPRRTYLSNHMDGWVYTSTHIAWWRSQSTPEIMLSFERTSPRSICWVPSTWKYRACDVCPSNSSLLGIWQRPLCFCAIAWCMRQTLPLISRGILAPISSEPFSERDFNISWPRPWPRPVLYFWWWSLA